MDKRAETISAAKAYIGKDDGLEIYLLQSALRNVCAELMADFHLSQSRDAWTPVEEGLPSQSGEYLVTRQMDVLVIDVLAFYHDDKRRGFWGGCTPDVIAWMPLPAPYEQPEEKPLTGYEKAWFRRNGTDEEQK
jgi:hypothetical protein